MKRIIGAVGVGNKTFTAGQEAEFETAAKAASVDFARLEGKGVIQGFSGKKAEVTASDAETATDAPAPKKAATKKSVRKR